MSYIPGLLSNGVLAPGLTPAAVRSTLDVPSNQELADAIGTVDLSGYLPLSGGTLTGPLSVNGRVSLGVYGNYFEDATYWNNSGFRSTYFSTHIDVNGTIRCDAISFGNVNNNTKMAADMNSGTIKATSIGVNITGGTSPNGLGYYFRHYVAEDVVMLTNAANASTPTTTNLRGLHIGKLTASGTIEQRNGLEPQSDHIYNTYTSDTDYERGFIRWDSDVLEIGTEKDGGGSSRPISLQPAAAFSLSAFGLDVFDVGTGPVTFYRTVQGGGGGVNSLGAPGKVWKDLYLRPSASLTPSSNGDLCIEATDNTTLTFKLKGSDGTVRSGTVTLA